MVFEFGKSTDLMAIEGMSHLTVLSLMSEVGLEGIRRFPSAKHFVSWLRFAPNNKIKGYLYLDQKRKQGIVKRINKQITRYGL